MARLFLEIQVGKVKSLYLVVPLDAPAGVVCSAWRIQGKGAEAYDVALHREGYFSCTCADSTMRSLGNCKHIRALKSLGLLGRQVDRHLSDRAGGRDNSLGVDDQACADGATSDQDEEQA